MKEEILKLRSEGKTYNQIAEILNCSKSTICYHCGEGQKVKTNKRLANSRKNAHPLTRKIENFKARMALKRKAERFQCRVSSEHPLKKIGRNHTLSKNTDTPFNPKAVFEKFSENPKCSLSGREINWEDSSSYTLDHIIPVHRGGDNSLENLQLLNPQVNLAKSSLTDEEFIALCKEVLIYQGYKIQDS